MKKKQIVLRRSCEEDFRSSTNSAFITSVRYAECQKNHAANIGGFAVDGCREFMASGDYGTNLALICAACGCHRNYHRREEINEVVSESSSPPS